MPTLHAESRLNTVRRHWRSDTRVVLLLQSIREQQRGAILVCILRLSTRPMCHSYNPVQPRGL